MTMPKVISRQCGRACILFAALCVGASTRDDALIGYKEKQDQCTDTQDKCVEWSRGVLSQCIENAYYMRSFCRKACNTPPELLHAQQKPITQEIVVALSLQQPESSTAGACSLALSHHSARLTTTCRHGRGMPRRRGPGSSPPCTPAHMQLQSTTSAGTPTWGRTTSKVQVVPVRATSGAAPACSSLGVLTEVQAIQARRCADRPGCT